MKWIVIAHCEAVNNGKTEQFTREIATFENPMHAENFIEKCLPEARREKFEIIMKGIENMQQTSDLTRKMYEKLVEIQSKDTDWFWCNDNSQKTSKVEENGMLCEAVMEGRPWHSISRDKFNAKIVSVMVKDKYYLHQMYTTCFVEFESLEKLEEFKKYADENITYWNYDPVLTIDTSDENQVEMWREHIKE